MKAFIGLILAFSIGFACRFFDIPVPSPNRLIGALLVLAITLGYLFADRVLSPRSGPAKTIDTVSVSKESDKN